MYIVDKCAAVHLKIHDKYVVYFSTLHVHEKEFSEFTVLFTKSISPNYYTTNHVIIVILVSQDFSELLLLNVFHSLGFEGNTFIKN